MPRGDSGTGAAERLSAQRRKDIIAAAACPQPRGCGAPRGGMCRKPDGTIARYIHTPRIVAAIRSPDFKW